MALTLNWYEQRLTTKFGSVILSEAQRELARREFEQFHNMMRQKEKTNSWQVPLELEFFDDGTYRVKIVDESKVLYLDD